MTMGDGCCESQLQIDKASVTLHDATAPGGRRTRAGGREVSAPRGSGWSRGGAAKP